MNTQQIAKQILELDPIILDTETTGLDDNDQIIEIAAITVSGQPLLNTLVKANKDSHPIALQTHGISREITDLKGREWSDVLADLNAIFECHPMCAYNEVFDTRMITQTCKAHKTDQPLHTTQFDIMELANRHFIEHTIWCNERSQFKRLSLAKCCEIAGIEFQGNAHRAIVDCHATLDLLKFMAEEKPDVASNDECEPMIECNACDWKGKLDDSVSIGSVESLCPECKETTCASNDDEHTLVIEA
jgi:DNA polymerase III epsilon subunit-like protein